MDPTGRYQIQRELGRGGMGVVSLALDTLLKRQVAIKSIERSEHDPQDWHDLLRRLAREAQLAGGLSHPNIVAIYDVIQDDTSPSIVMEYIKGKTLSEIAQPGAPVEAQFAIRVLRQCAAAIDHAEVRGIVHRDIKPSNIMVDDAGFVKLTDFGIAKPISPTTDITRGMAVGTLEYMSPEQMQAAPVTNRSDQYSLAVLAYRILTGQPIFESDTVASWCNKLLNEAPIPASQRNVFLPKAVDRVFLRAMAKNARDRYDSCAEFVNCLEKALLGPAVSEMRSPAVAKLPAEVLPAQSAQPSQWIAWAKIFGISVAVAAVIASAAIYFSSPSPAGKTVQPKATKAGPPPLPSLARQISDPNGDMVLVDGGAAIIGQNRDSVSVDSFYIDKTEVTNQRYDVFCQQTGHPLPPNPEAEPDYPVVDVSFDDAQAYARWANKRLPTAIEWEKAARGAQGFLYPWGNDMRDSAANLGRAKERGSLARADSFPEGASPYGALNMLGNAWEWVATPAAAPQGAQFQSQQKAFRLSPPLSPGDPYYQIRGGSFRLDTQPDELPTLLWNESAIPERAYTRDIGFRCARTP